MYNCNNCNKICPKWIGSTSVSVVTIAGTDTLVIDIPAGQYNNGEDYCIFVLQSIPDAATVNMPVAISIGGVTTTVYPLVCYSTCLQAVAPQVCARSRICTKVQTDPTSGVFKAYKGLRVHCPNVLASIPVPATT